jgi:DNA-3-methyladenine glycosylase II
VSETSSALTVETLRQGTYELARKDRDLAVAVERHGVPPMWARTPGYSVIVKIILEQQVSLASAKSSYDRLRKRVGRITPTALGQMSLREIRACGFTRQKAEYTRDIARLITSGQLSLQQLQSDDDASARERLMSIRGIGAWTADVYILMALRRADIWPDGDVALSESMRVIKRMRKRPDNTRMRKVAAQWRPWRSVAARILWQDYLARRK